MHSSCLLTGRSVVIILFLCVAPAKPAQEFYCYLGAKLDVKQYLKTVPDTRQIFGFGQAIEKTNSDNNLFESTPDNYLPRSLEIHGMRIK